MKLLDTTQVAVNLVRLLRSQWWHADRIATFQAQRLVRIMQHAIANVPYYKALGFKPDSITSYRDIERFPVLTKKNIQESPDAFLCRGMDSAKLHRSRTSGSSGEPTITYFDRDCWLATKYTFKIRRVVACVNPLLKRLLIVTEQSPSELKESAGNIYVGRGFFIKQIYLSIHDPIEEHVSVVKNYRPHILYAFPSYLEDLVNSFRASGSSIPVIPIIFTSSEVLREGTRRQVEEACGGRIYDVYGSTEFKEVAWQCARGRYHLNFESVYIEHTDEDDSVGTLLISSLNNYAMPLLRFRLGDQASLGHGRCACGRESPYLGAIQGRETETVLLPSGRRVSPYLLTIIIESHPGIRRYQITQTARAHLLVTFVPYEGRVGSNGLRALAEKICDTLKERIDVTFQEVTEIPRTPRGKYKVFAHDHTLQDQQIPRYPDASQE